LSRVFWDTNLFIYLFEENPKFSKPVMELRRKMIERKDELVTSTMTLAEIQVVPRRAGDLELAVHYRDTIQRVSRVVSFDGAAADKFAELRVNPAIQPADAIQLSCAAAAGVTIFITNDLRLTRLRIPGIDFVTTMDRLPF
jgi:predicted nucleic acid-binding protein